VKFNIFLDVIKHSVSFFTNITNSNILFVIVALSFGNLNAQHLFSVSYNDLSQENERQIETQIAMSRSVMSILKSHKSIVNLHRKKYA
jgi:hypothetical protein